MPEFEIVSDFKMTGDQPQVVERLVEGLDKGFKRQTPLGEIAIIRGIFAQRSYPNFHNLFLLRPAPTCFLQIQRDNFRSWRLIHCQHVSMLGECSLYAAHFFQCQRWNSTGP